MCQTEVLSEVHAHGSKAGYQSPGISSREPLRLLTPVPGETYATKGVGQVDRITCAEQMASLKAGDRIAIHKGDHRVYTIGTVVQDAEDNQISVRYDIVNPVGVAYNHSGQGHRILTRKEFDTIVNQVVRGF